MTIRINLLFLFLVAISGILRAQDIIETKDGRIIKAHIINVGEENISYTNVENSSGGEYIIEVSTIRKITFEGGYVQDFENVPNNVTAAYSKYDGVRNRPYKFAYIPAKGARISVYYMRTQRDVNSHAPGFYVGFRTDLFELVNEVYSPQNRTEEAGFAESKYYNARTYSSTTSRSSITFGPVFNLYKRWLFLYSGFGLGQFHTYTLYDQWEAPEFIYPLILTTNYKWSGNTWMYDESSSNNFGIEFEGGLVFDAGALVILGFTMNNFQYPTVTMGLGFSF